MNITIDRELCVGHRLMNHKGKCRHLHGHNYILSVTLAQQEPHPDTGMIVDFKDLKSMLVELVEIQFDHRTVLYEGDPFVDLLREVWDRDTVLKESFVLIDQHPTAENLVRHMGRILDQAIPQGVLERVTLQETSNCRSSWSPHGAR